MAALPLRFEVNQGQWDSDALFAARKGRTTLVTTDHSMVIAVHGEGTTSYVSMGLHGARRSAPIGERELETKSNFFLGNDPHNWRTNVPNFGSVRARGWLPGVDVVWHGDRAGTIEYDLEVAAGVDATQILMDVEGAASMAIDPDGSLVIETSSGPLVSAPPTVVQGSHRLVAGYRMASRTQVSFDLDGYDRNAPVLIDPTLVYATYLGGSGSESINRNSIAVDASKSAYFAASTPSVGLPVVNAFQSTKQANNDAYVAKLNLAGTALVYATYLGGSGGDDARAIAIDSSGNAYVTGGTGSPNFPLLNPYQSFPGLNDVFITKLSPTGSSLVFSTYLGANDAESEDIALGTNGTIWIAGRTTGTFPVVNPTQSGYGGNSDAFVCRLSSSGSSLQFSTLLGGGGNDYGYGLAVDALGAAYVTGSTESPNFPVASPLQSTLNGGADGFLTKYNGNSIVYSTYFGGDGADVSYDVAVDSSQSAYVVGLSFSSDLGTTGAFQQSAQGSGDAFVAKINAAGSARIYATYFGGSGTDEARGIAIDSTGALFVTGNTSSTNLPLVGAFQGSNGGLQDAFVAQMAAGGSSLVFSSYLGGSGQENGSAIALDSLKNMYVAGDTASVGMATSGALQFTKGGGTDGFIAKVGVPPVTVTPTSLTIGPGGTSVFTGGGGVGPYSFSLFSNATGATINPSTGSYTAGINAPGVDIVRVTDSLGGTADVAVNVTQPPYIASPPPPSRVAPNVQLHFTAAGGTAPYAWSLSTNASGGTIGATTGDYVSGSNQNTTDVVTLTDSFGVKDTRTVVVSTPLLIAPSAPTVTPSGSVSFSATGGFGPYKWTLLVNNSGASINLNSGAYLAGSTPGVIDTVQATDLNGTSTTTSVTILGPVSIAPSGQQSTPPKGTLQFTASGGSGVGYGWTLTSNLSGGSIQATTGAYSAGPIGGVTDVIKVTDSVGGSASTSVAVGPSVAITPKAPTTPPLGSIPFAATGGTGSSYAWSLKSGASGGSISPTSGVYTAGPTGTVVDTVRALDPLGNEALVNVSVGGGLAINPAAPAVVPKGTIAFSALGGSGTGFTWSIVTNASGGTMGVNSGSYTAGSAGNSVDVVEVADSLGNRARADVKVLSTLVISPPSATISRRGVVAFSGTGGRGGYTWAMQAKPSGGTVDASGVYTAGETAGVTDVVLLSDKDGNSTTAQVTVIEDSTDAGVVPDSGTATPTPPSGDGCACREGGTQRDDPTSLLGISGLAVLVALRRRRTPR